MIGHKDDTFTTKLTRYEIIMMANVLKIWAGKCTLEAAASDAMKMAEKLLGLLK